MATEVRVEATQVEVQQHGRVECRVVIDEKRVGRLIIGRRGVTWAAGGGKQGYEVSWKQLGTIIEERGKKKTL